MTSFTSSTWTWAEASRWECDCGGGGLRGVPDILISLLRRGFSCPSIAAAADRIFDPILKRSFVVGYDYSLFWITFTLLHPFLVVCVLWVFCRPLCIAIFLSNCGAFDGFINHDSVIMQLHEFIKLMGTDSEINYRDSVICIMKCSKCRNTNRYICLPIASLYNSSFLRNCKRNA